MDDEPKELNITPAWENAVAFEITKPDNEVFIAVYPQHPYDFQDIPFWEFIEEPDEPWQSLHRHRIPHEAVLAGNASCLEYNGYTIVPLLRAYEATSVMLANSTWE